MRAYIRTIGLSAASLALSAAAAAQIPVGTRITYQGSLTDGGAPASGAYDFQFRLRNLPVSGLPIGPIVPLNDVAVTNGVFTVPLDFGAGIFSGQARFLEIGVRPGVSGGAYTLLSPLQELTPAPYALYALNGGHWEANGTGITNANDGFVGVNRSTPVSGAEYFGIQAPTESAYGGMYIRTDGADALPFYGYKCGPTGHVAWTYLDGTTGKWHLYNDGTRVTVEDNGNVGIGTTDPVSKLHVNGESRFVWDDASDAGNAVVANGDGPANSSAIFASANFNGGSGAVGVRSLAFSSGAAIHATAYSTGHAGHFETLNPSNNTSTLYANHNGAGTGILGVNSGSGRGGAFYVSNNASAATALYCSSSGTGLAFHANGTARVDVLEITGADVAEKFPVSAEVKPGMVVMIDSSNAGKLCPSKGAYNPRVAGVVSGANGLPAGTILGNLPGNEDAPPIALSGRVWTMCDATDRVIDVGDSLTTAERPGHAMAASDRTRAGGAMIGKAMTALPKGEAGLVLVLVNLQ